KLGWAAASCRLGASPFSKRVSCACAEIGLRFFFSSRRRHTRLVSDWSSDVCSSDLLGRWGGGPVRGCGGRPQPGTDEEAPAGKKLGERRGGERRRTRGGP